VIRVLVISSFQEFWFRSRRKVCSEDRRINHTCNGNFTKTGNKRYKITIITYQKKFVEHLKKIEKGLLMLLYKYGLKAVEGEDVRVRPTGRFSITNSEVVSEKYEYQDQCIV
jgi:hypothetical protein